MVATSRNRKLALSEAWQHYWPVLFPGGSGWREDLEAKIRKRVYFPGGKDGFRTGGGPEVQPPPWASDLEIEFQGCFVAIKSEKSEFGPFPLFKDGLIPVLANWENHNPLAGNNDLNIAPDRHRERCRDFLFAAVLNCGNTVRQRLLGALKEAVQPEFEIFCRPSGDIFGKEHVLPVEGLAEFVGIDVPKSNLTDRLNRPKFSFVKIKQRSRSNAKAGPRGSFRELDADLVERMKGLIDEGKAPNVVSAAKMVCPDAPKRANANDESVVRRLQERFSEAYPNDSNRRGQQR